MALSERGRARADTVLDVYRHYCEALKGDEFFSGGAEREARAAALTIAHFDYSDELTKATYSTSPHI